MDSLHWRQNTLELRALRATPPRVARHAAALAQGYNHSANKALMGNTVTFAPQDVEENMAAMNEKGGYPFLLFVGEAMVGDADLRNLAHGCAEFAIMVGDPQQQGRGLGTLFTLMMHVLAFRELGLHTAVLSVVPQNVAALRCYEKVGYQKSASPQALVCCDDPTDVPMQLNAAHFTAAFPLAWSQVTCH